MARFSQVRGSRSTGQLERLLVIGLGLLVVLFIQIAPFTGRRAPSDAREVSPPASPVTASAPAAVPSDASATEPAEDASPAAEPARPGLADPPSFQVVAGGTGANLRSSPSTTAPVVEQVRDGAIVTNLDQQQSAEGMTWQRVADGSAEGWIASDLLRAAR